MRVGYDRADFTLNNPVVTSGIVDGGFQTFSSPPKLGDVVTFRRNGQNPYSETSYLPLNQIKLYESTNLLQEQSSKIEITSNTSAPLEGYEPINLLQNLKNRSCGGSRQSGMVSPYNGTTAEFLEQNSCFKPTRNGLKDNNHQFIFGIKF